MKWFMEEFGVGLAGLMIGVSLTQVFKEVPPLWSIVLFGFGIVTLVLAIQARMRKFER